ncbi:MAG: 30S ribosomal protein S8 [Patescibacteria group bacterium]|nr:30S ribosomal protein S8 [Patescibacteria group bacterium]
MMFTDPIADMLTRIRNASRVQKAEVHMPASRLKFAIAKILEHENFIKSVVEIPEAHGEIVITLRYEDDGQPTIRNIQRVSKPGRRVYAGKYELPRVLNDYGIAIISTSRGLMTNKEARKQKLGGEVICEVY